MNAPTLDELIAKGEALAYVTDLTDRCAKQAAQIADLTEATAGLRGAIELGQENCDNAYNDLQDERNALLLAVEDHARHYRQADHMSAKDRLKAIHELVAEFLDDHGVPKPAEEPSPAPGEMP